MSTYGDFTHWATGEPNQATVDEDCGAMKPDGKWIDVACRKQRLNSDTPFDRRAFTCKTSGKNNSLWQIHYEQSNIGQLEGRKACSSVPYHHPLVIQCNVQVDKYISVSLDSRRKITQCGTYFKMPTKFAHAN